jgi:hypothetical protein
MAVMMEIKLRMTPQDFVPFCVFASTAYGSRGEWRGRRKVYNSCALWIDFPVQTSFEFLLTSEMKYLKQITLLDKFLFDQVMEKRFIFKLMHKFGAIRKPYTCSVLIRKLLMSPL